MCVKETHLRAAEKIRSKKNLFLTYRINNAGSISNRIKINCKKWRY